MLPAVRPSHECEYLADHRQPHQQVKEAGWAAPQAKESRTPEAIVPQAVVRPVCIASAFVGAATLAQLRRPLNSMQTSQETFPRSIDTQARTQTKTRRLTTVNI